MGVEIPGHGPAAELASEPIAEALIITAYWRSVPADAARAVIRSASPIRFRGSNRGAGLAANRPARRRYNLTHRETKRVRGSP
jgi:hypothetical protein